MPIAPDIETLLDFESEISNGIAAQFTADLLPDIKRMQDGDEFLTPSYALKFSSSGVLNGHSVICPDGIERYDCYKGNLSVDIFTHRSVNKDKHKSYRSGVRKVMLGWRKRFGPEVMPYYEVGDIREGGSSLNKADEETDVTTLTYEIVFQIRADAWPTNLN